MPRVVSIADIATECVGSLRELGASVIIYGSYAYETQSEGSDLDLLVVRDNFTSELRKTVVESIRRCEMQLGLPTNDEVPKDVKVCATWSDLAVAATAAHFYSDVDGSPQIPKITKTPEFLSSRTMQLRLWQNILAGKILAFGDESALLAELQCDARRGFVNLYRGLGMSELSVTTLVDWLVGTGDSDLWLGFRSRPEVRRFLKVVFGDTLAELAGH